MILFNGFGDRGLVEFDPMSGHRHPTSTYNYVSGCFFQQGQNNSALYKQGVDIILQIQQRIWTINHPEVQVLYSHDVSSGTTSFLIKDTLHQREITYQAWWSQHGLLRPGQPEEDELNDFFGYVAEVWRNPELQQALLQSWV
ncbi:hypothetical protein [Oceanobacter mangrovi]|uniref:hypothetical protein n=1 Tax=Oceanobacter mangrovi TaxID=2862510 RepID=UPI001C8D203A|nr:hypothetical protein [Oceanobacter mangrovi]